jgi:hypothetical protein
LLQVSTLNQRIERIWWEQVLLKQPCPLNADTIKTAGALTGCADEDRPSPESTRIEGMPIFDPAGTEHPH